MDARGIPYRLTVVALMVVGLVALVFLVGALVDQVYFESSAEEVARAAAGAHRERIWGGVLAASAFAAAVLSERVVLLVNVLTGLAALITFSAPLIVLVPVAFCLEFGLALTELIPRRP